MHKKMIYYAYNIAYNIGMRTTLDIPEDLIEQAMAVTGARSKTDLIKYALKNVIDQKRRMDLIRYHGKLDLDINLDSLRER